MYKRQAIIVRTTENKQTNRADLAQEESDETPLAYFWLGEIYLVQEMFEDASEILNAFVAKFDDHPRKADGLYKLALTKVNLEELESAETLLQEVISNYPNSGAALLAEQDLIKLNPQ